MKIVADAANPWPWFMDNDGTMANVMSNYDGKINEHVADQLSANPGVRAGYPGWEFYGYVHRNLTGWACEIWRHHAPVSTLTAPTLEEIMSQACATWSSE